MKKMEGMNESRVCSPDSVSVHGYFKLARDVVEQTSRTMLDGSRVNYKITFHPLRGFHFSFYREGDGWNVKK